MTFKFQSLKPSDPYYSNWVEMRRRRRMAVIGFVAFPFAGLLLTHLLSTTFGGTGDDYVFWVIIPLMAVIALAYWRLMIWPCPRCGNWFYWCLGLIQIVWLFATHCMHCGLPKYAP